MSPSAPIEPHAAPTSSSRAPDSMHAWHVRPAHHDDVQAVAAAVNKLLSELDGTPADAPAMQAAARTLIDDPQAGAVLVAQTDDRSPAVGESPVGDGLVGVLAASWQIAIHVPGRYALIQDLWVSPDWRGKGIGAGLLTALFELARSRGVQRVEVGLPRERFAQFQATESFYLSNGFTPNGPRMRRILS